MLANSGESALISRKWDTLLYVPLYFFGCLCCLTRLRETSASATCSFTDTGVSWTKCRCPLSPGRNTRDAKRKPRPVPVHHDDENEFRILPRRPPPAAESRISIPPALGRIYAYARQTVRRVSRNEAFSSVPATVCCARYLRGEQDLGTMESPRKVSLARKRHAAVRSANRPGLMKLNRNWMWRTSWTTGSRLAIHDSGRSSSPQSLARNWTCHNWPAA